MLHSELAPKEGIWENVVRKLPERVHADRTGNRAMRILEARRIDRRFLLPDSIQSIDLQGIGWGPLRSTNKPARR